VTEGGVDRAGNFHRIPRLDDSLLAEIFGREVLALLVSKGLLSPERKFLSLITGKGTETPRLTA
jgi:hypothetical protein